MDRDALLCALKQEDFHIDGLGRIVTDNFELLCAVNNAGQGIGHDDIFGNIFCHNAHCR
jgi:hypothetical protein